jgi:prepilin-type N-terminal cleavage/methylation domain-containing protein
MLLPEQGHVACFSWWLVGSRRGTGGFTLIELLVVIVIIGVLAALAVPSLSLSSYERDTYNDAGSIMQLFREARTHAVGRGAATLVAISQPTGQTGYQFLLYEATTTNPGTQTAGGPALGTQTPVATCKYPTSWPLANMTPIDGVNLNGTIESLAGITVQPNQYFAPNGTEVSFTVGYVCYTPLGRSYINTNAIPPGSPNGTPPPTSTPSFGGALPTVNPIGIDVKHTGGTTIRTVLVPPNGMARIFSHT